MRAGSYPGPQAPAGRPGWGVVLLAMVIFHLMTSTPPLQPPGITPPDRTGGRPRKRHNTRHCRRLLVVRNDKWYCEGCERDVRANEIADSGPRAL